jgi:hypothetical protein
VENLQADALAQQRSIRRIRRPACLKLRKHKPLEQVKAAVFRGFLAGSFNPSVRRNGSSDR